MNVVFLRDCSIQLGHQVYCGDGCCSWMEWNSEQVKAGESFDEWNVQMDDLVEGIDYKYED